jgi:hypothetical protein
MVRNIYGLDFLDPRLVLGDVRIRRYAQGISLGMPLRSTAS